MNLSLGVGTLAVTTLVFAWAYGAHRRTQPAAWTKTILSMLLCVALVESSAIGIGIVILAAFEPATLFSTSNLAELPIAGALVLLTAFATPRLMAPGRTRPSADVIQLTPPQAPRPVSGGARRRAA